MPEAQLKHQWWQFLRQRPLALLGLLGLWSLQWGVMLALIPLARLLEPQLAALQVRAFGQLLAAVVGLYLLKNTAEYLQALLSESLTLDWSVNTRQQIFSFLLEQPWPEVQRHSPEQLLAVLSDDLNKAQLALNALLQRFLPSAGVLLILGSALLYLSPWLSLGLLTLGGLALLLKRLLNPSQLLPGHAQASQQVWGLLLQELGESLRHLALIRLYGLSGHQKARLQTQQQAWKAAQYRLYRRQALERPLMASLQIMLIALLLLLATWLVAQQWLSAADLLAYATALALAIDPGLWLAESQAQLQVGQGAWQRLTSLCLPSKAATTRTVFAGEALTASQLNLSRGQLPVLKGVHFILQPSEKVGLSGASGAGKSSFLGLLAGLEPPESGLLQLPSCWQKHPQPIVLVPQRASFFNQSLRENLCLQHSYPDQQLRAVLDCCLLSTWLDQLPQGLDTPLGARDSWLSGGERQRLAIARALLRRPHLLLLDEATSELDTPSEQRLFENLRQFVPEMGWVVVSHHSSSLQGLSKIWHLKEGQLFEQEAEWQASSNQTSHRQT